DFLKTVVINKNAAADKIAEMDKCTGLLGGPTSTTPADVFAFIDGLGDRTDAAARLTEMRKILAQRSAIGLPLFADAVAVSTLITSLGDITDAAARLAEMRDILAIDNGKTPPAMLFADASAVRTFITSLAAGGDITGAVALLAEMRKILAISDGATPPAALFSDAPAVNAFITSIGTNNIKNLLGAATLTATAPAFQPFTLADEATVNAQKASFDGKKANLSASATFPANVATRVTRDFYSPGPPLQLPKMGAVVGAADIVAGGALGAFVEHLLENKTVNSTLLNLMTVKQQELASNLARLFALLPVQVLTDMNSATLTQADEIALVARGVVATLADCSIPLKDLPDVLSIVSALKYRLVGWNPPLASPSGVIVEFVSRLLEQSRPTSASVYWDEILLNGTVTDLTKVAGEAVNVIAQSPVISAIASATGATGATKNEKKLSDAIQKIVDPAISPANWGDRIAAADTLIRVAVGIYNLIVPVPANKAVAMARMGTFVGHMADLIKAVQYTGSADQEAALKSLAGHLTRL
ncbi:MAG: hypothetical protein EBZ60_08660, partial [Betaproteobacteria bacterium]|nr:hypothetical protein [Betaproteobacteria bacterium]